ncbi:MAG TPA: class III lanthionine synthetase LanKC [Aeriscardovia aeriphila]|uniref:Class III lanthionine synthetase LanKC n=1 Tax=Aeriscardovia aeriphila TaxID=218139 RepID=A0A921FXM6_9BIFI|nr:class III lanthionine synthetase LanKC [Aeriscardovia aeriphila]
MVIIYSDAMSYEQAAKNGNSFYYMQQEERSDNAQTVKNNKLYLMGLPQGWETFSDEHWTYVLSQKTTFPNQGWKIHISAATAELQLVLQEVADFLIAQDVSFKYVPSVDEWIAKNSKYADRAYSGKFITIYPSSTQQFIWLLDKLKAITDKYSLGPYILNDKAWKESNVYFRYGGLKKMTALIDGQEKAVIYTPAGEAIEDLRVPYYTLPDFVTEPDEIASVNQDVQISSDSHFSRYAIKQAIHFSNAGGVYRASDKKRDFIVKEGRKGAGIDATGRDGFSRVENEYRVLSHLANVEHVVNPIEFFVEWRHAYLVEEYGEGNTLQQVVATEYPFSQAADKSEAAEVYARKMLKAAAILKETIQKIHQCGIAVCDISPQNILLNAEGIPTIIDCEAGMSLSAHFAPSLATRGYVSYSARTFEEQDWYAYRQIIRMMFYPSAPLQELAPTIEVWQNKAIEEKFGEAVLHRLLELAGAAELHAVSTNLGKVPYPLFPLTAEISTDTLGLACDAMARGIISAWDEKTLSFPGDVSQSAYQYGKDNIATGSAGVLIALSRYATSNRMKLSVPEREKLNSAVHSFIRKHSDHYLKAGNRNDYGLFSGITGIKLAQYELGSATALSELTEELTHDRAWLESSDISLFSGISGIALALLAQDSLTTDDYQDLLERAVIRIHELWEAREKPQSTVTKANSLQAHSAIDYGLLTGWAGAALFTWEYSQFGNNENLRAISREMTVEIVQHAMASFTVDKGEYYAIDQRKGFNRLVSYIESGTAGIALLLLEVYKDDPTALTKDVIDSLQQLLDSCLPSLSYNCSLFSGMAGFIPIAHAGESLGLLDKNAGDVLIKEISHYLLRDDSEVLVPGWFGYKCSTDYISGSAGVLLAFHSISEEGSWSEWFPLHSSKLRLFAMHE